MKKVQCLNKHFYDADTYDLCPHCGAAPMELSTPQTSNTKPKKGVFRFFDNQKNQPADQSLPSRQTTHTENGRSKPEQQSISTQSLAQEAPPSINPQSSQHNAGGLQNQVNMVATRSLFDANRSSAPNNPQTPSIQDVPKTVPLQPSNNQNQPVAPVFPILPSEVADKSSADDGKTRSIFSGPSNDDPVVGWLVCLKGSNIGKSYELAARSNTIGRLYSNDVVLENEPQVSRESHAIIEFDYKKSDFYLHKANGNSPYINDEIVLSAQKLNRFDKIEIGGCLLLFVPLCGEDFSWNDYINKE